VNATTLYQWKREYYREAEAQLPEQVTPETERYRELEKRYKELEEENAILKKAMGYFSTAKK